MKKFHTKIYEFPLNFHNNQLDSFLLFVFFVGCALLRFFGVFMNEQDLVAENALQSVVENNEIQTKMI